MNIFELAKTVNQKQGGDVNDFIDYLVIIRGWLDINFTLIEELMGNLVVSDFLYMTDERFISLREKIMNKKIRNKQKKIKTENKVTKVKTIENLENYINDYTKKMLEHFEKEYEDDTANS